MCDYQKAESIVVGVSHFIKATHTKPAGTVGKLDKISAIDDNLKSSIDSRRPS